MKPLLRVSGGIKFWDPSWGLQYWKSQFNYSWDGILICSLILGVYFVWKANEGKTESVALLIIVGGWVVVGCGRKSYSGPAEIVSFSRRDLSRSDKHDIFWHVASTGYFYILSHELLLLQIFVPRKFLKT